MSSYKVEICGVNTAKLPVLKEEEKDALFARIKQGDAAARETYIKGNLRLCIKLDGEEYIIVRQNDILAVVE